MNQLLSLAERDLLEAAYRSAEDKRTASRVNILLLLDDGSSHEEVAAILKLDDATIRRQEKAYKGRE